MQFLVIEDESGISRFLKQGLEEAFLADNGTAGLRMARVQKYDLLLVDWMLPGLSGLEVC